MKFNLILAIIWLSLPLTAQTVEYDIPLSKPGEMGTLQIDVYNASISVVTHKQDKVHLRIVDKRILADKRIGSAEFLYDISEKNNIVRITNRTDRRIKGLALELSVPANFSAKLKTYFGSELMIKGLEGEVEAVGYHTRMKLENLQGSIVASTNQGPMEVILEALQPENTYFLSNYAKNLILQLPDDAACTLLMDNDFGKFSSDFPLALDLNKGANNPLNYVRRKINNGGAEVRLVNYFGKILVERNN